MLRRSSDDVEQMKALVTGAGGFVGRHLVQHLRTCGDDVSAATRDTAPDLLEPDAWRRHLAKVQPEVVFHLAGQASVSDSWIDPLGTFRANAEGTLHLLEACRANGISRVLCVSTADVYGIVEARHLPLCETAPARPVTPYASSKLAAEALALQAALGHGQEVLIARPFLHMGPGQDNRFVGAALASRIALAEADDRASAEVAVGNLSPRRDITDVRDVVAAYRLLMAHGVPGLIYNVCSGRAVSIRELAERLLARAVRPLTLRDDPTLMRPVDIPLLQGDPTRLKAATGWEPVIALGDTIDAVLAEARSRVSR